VTAQDADTAALAGPAATAACMGPGFDAMTWGRLYRRPADVVKWSNHRTK